MLPDMTSSAEVWENPYSCSIQLRRWLVARIRYTEERCRQVSNEKLPLLRLGMESGRRRWVPLMLTQCHFLGSVTQRTPNLAFSSLVFQCRSTEAVKDINRIDVAFGHASRRCLQAFPGYA